MVRFPDPLRPVTLVAVVVGVAALHLGRPFLIPVALAILLTFLLAPLADRLERLHLGRAPSVILCVVLIFAPLGVIGWLVTQQTLVILEHKEEYGQNLQQKLRGVMEPIRKVRREIEEVRRREAAEADAADAEAEAAARAADGSPRRPREPAPVSVTIDQPRTTIEVFQAWFGPLLGHLAAAGIVLVLTLFMLLQREDLRDRLIRLVSRGQISRTTRALGETARSVRRYLLMTLVVNLSYGIPVAIGLHVIGVPGAVLWGLLCTVLRFIPYVGPWVAAALPTLLSVAAFDTWEPTLWVVGMFVGLELISNNVVEPMVYSRSTGLSTVAVLVMAVFWTWVWGPAGLLLAIPMTLCLAVVGRYVPELSFLHVLFSSEPSLDAHVRTYQRLLANDPEEARQVVREFLTARSPAALADEVIVPALSLLERDREHGEVDDAHLEYVLEAVEHLVEDVGKAPQAQGLWAALARSRSVPPEVEPDEGGASPVLCLPAHGETDAILAAMLARLLRARGTPARALGPGMLAGEMVEAVKVSGASAVCVSALPPFGLSPARYLVKRLLQRLPDLIVTVGVWDREEAEGSEPLEHLGAAHVFGTLERATERLRAIQADQTARAG